MKEQLVAKLDKMDIKELKGCVKNEEEIERMVLEFHSKTRAFWDELTIKHKLGYSGGHYIKGNAIYRQSIETP